MSKQHIYVLHLQTSFLTMFGQALTTFLRVSFAHMYSPIWKIKNNPNLNNGKKKKTLHADQQE